MYIHSNQQKCLNLRNKHNIILDLDTAPKIGRTMLNLHLWTKDRLLKVLRIFSNKTLWTQIDIAQTQKWRVKIHWRKGITVVTK